MTSKEWLLTKAVQMGLKALEHSTSEPGTIEYELEEEARQCMREALAVQEEIEDQEEDE